MLLGFLLAVFMQLPCTAYANGGGIVDNSTDTQTVFKEEVAKNVGKGKKIYFACPMFSQADKNYNLEIVKILEDYGYNVFLPQRDGIEAAQLEGKTEEELTKMIFELDAGD